MVTGYQRQNRKSINFMPTQGSDEGTVDQYTKLISNACSQSQLLDAYSKACELSCVSGMVLLQPYLDFTGDDPGQGDLKIKTWEYNSFLVDPFFREPDMSDANYVWCQEYISKAQAKTRFPFAADKVEKMQPIRQTSQNRFYFLPEQYNAENAGLFVLSYVWVRGTTKKKMLYSQSRNQYFDAAQEDVMLEQIIQAIPDLTVVEKETQTWKQTIVLNDQLLWYGDNPLGIHDAPFVPMYWNYDPHISKPELRVRSLVRSMRSSQFLLNRRIILNHDIAEASINAGYIRKSGAVANEEVLNKTGQGHDIVINEGYELTDIQKIEPSSVPASDLQMAQDLQQMIFGTSGVNLESWSAQDQQQISSMTMLLKQGANLMVLQKYFDQWDNSLKLLGERMLQIALTNWNEQKVQMMIGEPPSPLFYSKIFAKYKTTVTEGLDTAVQQQREFQQTLELNQMLGGVIPPSYIVSIATLQGKEKLMQVLQQQEEQQAAQAQQMQGLQAAFEEAKLKELISKSANNMAMAKEREGRAVSNVGLLDERLSEVQKNQALAIKSKMEATQELLNTIERYGALEQAIAEGRVEQMDQREEIKQGAEKAREKASVKASSS